MNSTLLIFIVVAVAAVAIFLIAYRSGDIDPFGTFKPSRKVEQYFKRHQLPKQYHYYFYRESASEIFALAGLERDYTITGDAWHEFEPEEETVEQLLAQIVSDTAQPAEGYLLFSPDNTPMGIFYSPLLDPAIQVNPRQEVTFTLDLLSSLTDREG